MNELDSKVDILHKIIITFLAKLSQEERTKLYKISGYSTEDAFYISNNWRETAAESISGFMTNPERIKFAFLFLKEGKIHTRFDELTVFIDKNNI